MTKRNLEICEQRRRDCFANHDNVCTALTDTHFKKMCPFYKSKKQYKEENRENLYERNNES